MIWPPPPTAQKSLQPPRRLHWWQKLTDVPEGPATNAEVWAWWQARRWAYNKLVFGLGIPSFFLYVFFVATSANLPPGEDLVEPLALLAAPVMVPLMVNIGYTAGPVGELLWRTVFRIRTRKIGRLMMQAGLAFSLLVVLAPSVVWGMVWVWHLLTGHRVNAL